MNRWRWVAEPVVRALHERLLADHGGLPGPVDDGRLESALARPRHLAAYGEPDIFDLAAAYAAGIIPGHPFVDGNKRIGFMTSYVFLADNGRQLVAEEADAVRMVLALAAGALNEARFATWLRENCDR